MNGKKRIGRKVLLLGCFMCMGISVTGCGKDKKEEAQKATPQATEVVQETEPAQFTESGETFTAAQEYVYTTTQLNVRKECSTDAEVIKVLPEQAKILRIGQGETWSKVTVEEGDYYVASEYLTTQKPDTQGHLIAIDATHQETGNDELEEIGPGATEKRAKVTEGATGVSTGQKEYDLTLRVAKYLEQSLSERGYEVFMVRESNDVNLSNHERCTMAEQSGAEVYIRLQANASDVQETSGAMTICGTENSPYVADLYADSRRLSERVLEQYVEKTGASDKGIWETDVMAGINWSSLPVTIVELGYLSNAQEDEKMATEEYQKQMAEGIAEGVEAYFAE